MEALRSKYADYTDDQITEHLSNFLISSWSYSMISQFARNQKVFEMVYIYLQKSRSGASAIAGTAYHLALEIFFRSYQLQDIVDYASLEIIALDKIDSTPANNWKLQKTTPTVADAIVQANTSALAGLRNFYSEMATYLDEIDEVLDVELYCDEWLNINGVDIPLPCHMKIDLVIRTKSQKIVIVDHKLKKVFSDEQELRFTASVQAITYVKGYEAKTGLKVDEVWFVENKYAKNKDGGRQVVDFRITMDDSTKRLYEFILYSSLRKMIQAVNDEDYDYIINDSDTYQDKAEVYQFMAQTMIAEIDDFPVDPTKKHMIAKRMKKIRDASLASINPSIIKKFKENASAFIQYDLTNKT